MKTLPSVNINVRFYDDLFTTTASTWILSFHLKVTI